MNLFGKIGKEVGGIVNFMNTLDCLYALGQIELDEQTELLSYVD